MMFRWVVLQLAELEKCSSRYEIDKQLAELPEGLDETYNRILIKHRQETLCRHQDVPAVVGLLQVPDHNRRTC